MLPALVQVFLLPYGLLYGMRVGYLHVQPRLSSQYRSQLLRNFLELLRHLLQRQGGGGEFKGSQRCFAGSATRDAF